MPQTDDCLAGQNLRQVVAYQPANRFWEFQGMETAILLAASALLAARGILWIHAVRILRPAPPCSPASTSKG